MEKEEIKVWNEGKPHILGGSGAFSLFGGVLGRGAKLFTNTVKQYLKGNPTLAKSTTKHLTQQSLKGTPVGPKVQTMKDLKVKGPHNYEIPQL